MDLDFCGQSVFVTFEADETFTESVFEITAQINITDDNINEAEQIFVVGMELEYALENTSVLLERRPSSLCRIIDNDRKYVILPLFLWCGLYTILLSLLDVILCSIELISG